VEPHGQSPWHLTNAQAGRHPGQKFAHSSTAKGRGFLLPGKKVFRGSRIEGLRHFRRVFDGYLEKSEEMKGDEKRWEERNSSIYFSWLVFFLFFLHATLVMFQTLNLT
jgi:hypothetical protein